MKILLQHKIFVGYILLMAIIGSMVAIVLHERNRVQKIEDKSITISSPSMTSTLPTDMLLHW